MFCGLLYNEPEQYLKALSLLEARFGGLLVPESPEQCWTHSHYYEKELGSPVRRRFLFFDRMIPQDALRDFKLQAMELEAELAQDDRRTVNIDPGYVTTAKVVLASTKDYAHRIYIGGGIFAEVTLYYMHGAYHGGPFAYSDYLSPDVMAMFDGIRRRLK